MNRLFQIENLDVFEQVSTDVLENLYNSHLSKTSKNHQSIAESAKEYLRQQISQNDYDMVKVAEIISHQELSQDKLNIFVPLLNNNKAEILTNALVYYKSNYGEAVTNIDWVLKVIFGISELKTLQYPLLQLQLTTMNKNNTKVKHTFDFSKDMLNDIIYVLEKDIKS